MAQSKTRSDLFYTLYGQQIPLTVKPNTIAVAFRETSGTRSSNLPLHLQLQQDLEGRSNTRGGRDRLAATQIDLQ